MLDPAKRQNPTELLQGPLLSKAREQQVVALPSILMKYDGICVRDTVNTDFMEGVLPVSSTGFAPVVFMAQHLRSVIHSMEFVGLRSYNFVGLRLVLR